MLTILEHFSSSYAPRTYANAAKADVTIALAVDYTTAGEKCTHKAAGDKYLKLELSEYYKDNARKLWRKLDGIIKPTINVAGNGIYTLARYSWTQEDINEYVYLMLNILHDHLPIGKIVSGGQTGVDIAGAWTGYKLGIDVEVLLPKGFKQRFEDGVDITQTREDIERQIIS